MPFSSELLNLFLATRALRLWSVTRERSSYGAGQGGQCPLKLPSDWALAWLCATDVVTTRWTDERVWRPAIAASLTIRLTARCPRQYTMAEALTSSRSQPTCSILLSRLWKRRVSDQDRVASLLCKDSDSETGVMIPWELPVNVTARLLEDSALWTNVLVAAACSRELQLLLDIDANVHKTRDGLVVTLDCQLRPLPSDRPTGGFYISGVQIQDTDDVPGRRQHQLKRPFEQFLKLRKIIKLCVQSKPCKTSECGYCRQVLEYAGQCWDRLSSFSMMGGNEFQPRVLAVSMLRFVDFVRYALATDKPQSEDCEARTKLAIVLHDFLHLRRMDKSPRELQTAAAEPQSSGDRETAEDLVEASSSPTTCSL